MNCARSYFSFTVEGRDGRARAGLLHTPHGDVPTPCFMPVGTKATVKAVAPRSLRELGARVVLANAYQAETPIAPKLSEFEEYMAMKAANLTAAFAPPAFVGRQSLVDQGAQTAAPASSLIGLANH